MYDVFPSNSSAGVFSSDGSKILLSRCYPRRDNTGTFTVSEVYVLSGPHAGEVFETQPTLDEAAESPLEWSPDGTSFIFLRGGTQIWQQDAECRHPRLVAKAAAWEQVAFDASGKGIYFLAPDHSLHHIRLDGQREQALQIPQGWGVNEFTLVPGSNDLILNCRINTAWLPPAPPDVLSIHGVLYAPMEPLVKLLGYADFCGDDGNVIHVTTCGGREFFCKVGSTGAQENNGKLLTLAAPRHSGCTARPIARYSRS